MSLMNILIVDDHPLFRHALIQAVRYSLPQAQIRESMPLMQHRKLVQF